VESFTGLSLVTRNARFTDAWPHCGALMLPAWPLTVTEVRALTTEGVATTMAASQWRLRDDSRPAVVSVLSRPAGAATIEVRFTAGFGAPAEVPAALRLAVLSLAAQWYDTRGVEPDENETLPGAVRRLLSPWRGLRL
jgi:uncharacterized phiE125 gp8 family phage protein